MQLKENHCAVMKRFFVDIHYRLQKIGLSLYQKMLSFAKEKDVRPIILDTSSVAHALHRFYETVGFTEFAHNYFRFVIFPPSKIPFSISWIIAVSRM